MPIIEPSRSGSETWLGAAVLTDRGFATEEATLVHRTPRTAGSGPRRDGREVPRGRPLSRMMLYLGVAELNDQARGLVRLAKKNPSPPVRSSKPVVGSAQTHRRNSCHVSEEGNITGRESVKNVGEVTTHGDHATR